MSAKRSHTLSNDDPSLHSLAIDGLPGAVHSSSLGEALTTDLLQDVSTTIDGRDSMSPAVLLPPEILCNIFDLVRLLHSSRRRSRSLRWIVVTHVCRQWRNTAIAFPALWSHISFRHTAFAEIMLQRSKGALLSLEHRSKEDAPEGFEAVFNRVLSQPERLRMVDLCTNGSGPEADTCASSIVSILDRPLPHLEQLRLFAASGGLLGLPRPRPLALRIPWQSLFGGHAPSLQHLDLEECPASIWKALPFASTALTSLLLRAPISGRDRPTMTDFMGALSRMANLRRLSLHHILPLLSDHSPAFCFGSASYLLLPALEDLKLKDSLDSIDAFVACIRIPESTAISIDMSERVQDSLSISRFLENLANTNPSRTLVSFGIYSNDFFLGFIRAQVKLRFDIGAQSFQHLATAFSASFDLSPLTEFQIAYSDSGMFATQTDWTALGSLLPNVESISIEEGDSITGFVDALKLRPNEGASQSLYYFPALSEIFLCVDFKERNTATRSSIDGLIEGIRWREEAGFPIRVLEIECCNYIFEEDYERIKAASPSTKVTWDGITDGDGPW
ncbi:hypothetical protein NMY22_g11832 [Coprinellus aureogranulatus]|nr:hypothetical protein NMY22_g11832 [Coprinellus aureogranulatus]